MTKAAENFERLHREQRLAVELGVAERGEWHSTKRGGPVHYWRRMGHGVGMWQAECGTYINDEHLGKLRDPVTVRRPCKKCRERLIEFYVT